MNDTGNVPASRRDRRVLLAPAALRWAPDAGSEHAFTYGFAEILEQRGWSFLVVAEEAGPGAMGEVHAVGRRRTDHLGGLRLPLRIALFAAKPGSPAKDVALVHHGLPFALDRTFSLLPYLHHFRRLPFVVGPLQPPQLWVAADEPWADSRRGRFAARAAERLARQGAAPAVAVPLRWLSTATLRRAAHVVATGDVAREMVLARGVEPTRCSVIRPAVAPIFLDVTANRPVLTPVGGRAPEPLRCISVGKLISRKGWEVLLEGMAHAVSAGRDLNLCIVGEGPERANLEHAVQRAGLGRRVTFLGTRPRSEIPDLLAEADVFVTMSHSESVGMAVAEAMATGLPVVSAANTGARDLVLDGECGRLIPPADAEALATVLADLEQNRDLCRRMGHEARSRALSIFHPETVADAWEGVYRQALAEAGTRARPTRVVL